METPEATRDNPGITLSVSNFGPIKQATDIAIRPLTIFVGPSNTGKSYLAILIHSLLRTMSLRQFTGDVIWRSVVNSRGGSQDEIDSNTAGSALLTIKTSIIGRARKEVFLSSNDVKKMRRGEIGGFNDLSTETQTGLHSLITIIFQDMGGIWNNELKRCMGVVTMKDLVNGENRLAITVKHGELWTWRLASNEEGEIATTSFENNIFTAGDESQRASQWRAISEQMSDVLRRLDAVNIDTINQQNKDWITWPLVAMIIGEFLTHSLDHWVHRTWYLPAARTGLIQSFQPIAASGMNQMTYGTMATVQISTLNGIMSDFLQGLILIKPDRHTGLQDLATYLEEEILKGTISIDQSSGFPRFIYKQDDLEIPMLRSSSSVTDLAPIVLFLRYYLDSNDTLIIEEPEAQLHTGAQRKIAGAIVRMMQKGLHVVVTTHSDFILEQLSNYIHFSSVSDDAREEIMGSRDRDLYLKLVDVAGYGFHRSDGGGTIVEKIEYDPIEGLITPDHAEVASDLYNQTVNVVERTHPDE